MFFNFNSLSVGDMGGSMDGRNQDNINYDTSPDAYTLPPPSLEEEGNTAADISVASDNYGNECNN